MVSVLSFHIDPTNVTRFTPNVVYELQSYATWLMDSACCNLRFPKLTDFSLQAHKISNNTISHFIGPRHHLLSLKYCRTFHKQQKQFSLVLTEYTKGLTNVLNSLIVLHCNTIKKQTARNASKQAMTLDIYIHTPMDTAEIWKKKFMRSFCYSFIIFYFLRETTEQYEGRLLVVSSFFVYFQYVLS